MLKLFTVGSPESIKEMSNFNGVFCILQILPLCQKKENLTAISNAQNYLTRNPLLSNDSVKNTRF